jgi:hypothetical protein
LTKDNPIQFLKVEELKFDEAVFGATDPLYMEMKEKGLEDK